MKKLFPILLLFILPAEMVFGQARINLQNGYVVNNGAVLVVQNSNPNAITRTNGWIVSETEFSQVEWTIGTSTGTYVVPFGYSNTDYLPLTCQITTGGAGIGNGIIKFSSYHGSTWDNSLYKPSDVVNMTDFGATDYSNNAVDRFWILDAQGYSTKPSPDITFSYIRSGAASEIDAPNYIIESDLIAQRFNSSSNVWSDWLGVTGADVTNGNTGTVNSGTVTPADFYRSWSLFVDSTLITAGVPSIDNDASAYNINLYPNPTMTGSFAVSGLTKGQTIEVYNALGQQVTSKIVDNSTMLLSDISTQSNGMYFLRVLDSDGNLIAGKKVIKTQ